MKRNIVFATGAIFLILLWWAISIYPDWLWFGRLGFSTVFWTTLLSKLGLGISVWFFFLLITFISIFVASKLSKRAGIVPVTMSPSNPLSQSGLTGGAGTLIIAGLVFFIGLMIAIKASSSWDVLLRYLHSKPFGINDPILKKEVSFYVFTLPFYLFLKEQLLACIILAGIFSALWYFKTGAIQLTGTMEFNQLEQRPTPVPKFKMAVIAKRHLIFLAGLLVLVIAWGYYLKIYGLMYSTNGAAFGPCYTDVHIRMPVYIVITLASLIFSLFLFTNAFRFRSNRIITLAGIIWVALIFLLSSLVPMAVQKFVVKPNELTKESRYIANNIKFTTKAYSLDKVQEVNFPALEHLTMKDIQADNGTIQNIRIWDKRPLLQTYRQLQAIRLYYNFMDVDVDRYEINGAYRQINLSARELVADQLPPQANTWVNRHLIYTHGYGLTASLVSEVTSEGLPRLIIKDLPPSIDVDLPINRPEIYYGEATQGYVLVKTKAKEFDYPKGDKNVYTSYQGKGGVPVGSFVRRLLFSVEFLDPQILFTSYISDNSRIMYNRQIDQRVRAIAPFLAYDSDPYLVISGGKLYWIVDAYTASNMYPYSTRSRFRSGMWVNYLRNSVKVVIDAYNGDVNFYIIDEKDPILRTYAEIFPRLFKKFGQMPAGIKKHIRYPKDLFKVQIQIYKSYHMKDVQVFYNQEDLWEVPSEIYGNSPIKMEPYHVILRLPNEKKDEFVLMIPFTPSKKDNMIAWMAARCDEPDYGRLIVYKLPKEKLVFGPMQIEARVDQQTKISRELTLWGQRGSTVIRGNLLAIPIRKTFVYVEPVYLVANQEQKAAPQPASPQRRPRLVQRRGARNYPSPAGPSATAALPELKRIIVAFGNRLTMQKDLQTSLSVLLGKAAFMPSPGATPEQVLRTGNLAAQALEHYVRAKRFLREGDWAGYGRELDALEQILKQMAKKK